MQDAEIMEKINKRDTLLKKFKESLSYVNKTNYNEAMVDVQKLIRTKKKAYFESKLTDNICRV